jgi:hypothetical protein
VTVSEDAPAVSVEAGKKSEPDVEFRVPADDWEQHVTALAQGLTTPEALPPLIVLYDYGKYRISDGNMRREAVRRRGCGSCWVIVWYTSEDDYRQAAQPNR